MRLYGEQLLVPLQDHGIDDAVFRLHADQFGVKQKLRAAFYHHIIIDPLELFHINRKLHSGVIGLRAVKRVKYLASDPPCHKMYAV